MKDSALIVVDMLYDFIDGSLACQEAEKAVAGSLFLWTISLLRKIPDIFPPANDIHGVVSRHCEVVVLMA